MATGSLIRQHQYYDSVFLMGVNKRLSQMPGVRQTAVLMGTENNKRLLADIGVAGGPIDAAGPGDLMVAVIGESEEAVAAALAGLDAALVATTGPVSKPSFHSFEDALRSEPLANLAVITLPGEYVYKEARKAVEAGLNVFIFSSNVPSAQELELKQLATTKGQLVMGPDCGTSLLGGVGIGFANAVRRGRIGVVGPSGTGLQEFTTQIHHADGGISHAIGTGSHDLSDAIGGLTTFAALDALERDDQTEVVALVAKPPGPKARRRLDERLSTYRKPTVACFLGIPVPEAGSEKAPMRVRTIDEAAQTALELLGTRQPRLDTTLSLEEHRRATDERRRWSARQTFLRGIFAGGTFCYQAQQILRDRGLATRSNAPLSPDGRLADPDVSVGHTLVDMGDEGYTLGRPHPMIDATLRNLRVLAEGRDPETAILLLDFILGYNAAEDPVGDLMDAILEAGRSCQAHGGHLSVVASICGTEADPQDLALQRRLLEDAGVFVFDSSARAALFCGELLKPG